MLSKVLDFLGGGAVSDIIGKFIPDKTKAAELAAELQKAALDNASQLVQAQRDIIVAEARGESWPQRNWRPCLMFLIMALLVWNGVAVPLVSAFAGVTIPTLEAWQAIPDEMWNLLTIGLGGYIVGRSAEKTAKHWRNGTGNGGGS